MASIPTLPSLSGNATLSEVIDHVAILQKTLTFMMSSNLGTSNIAEVGGWLLDDTQIAAENATMGLSSAITDANDIRIWAGDAVTSTAPFRVYEDGTLYASKATISGNITMTGGTITWGAVGAPLYSDILGTKPPANADNTDTIITAGGSNFTKVAGAYVYSGPADYTQITGSKPPSNADNTASSLPASLGINYTQIGSTYIYTGTLNANQINAGTLNANYINGGTISGVDINVAQDITVGNNIYFKPTDSVSNKSLNFGGRGSLTFRSNGVTLSAYQQLNLQSTLVTYNDDEIATHTWALANVVAKYG